MVLLPEPFLCPVFKKSESINKVIQCAHFLPPKWISYPVDRFCFCNNLKAFLSSGSYLDDPQSCVWRFLDQFMEPQVTLNTLEILLTLPRSLWQTWEIFLPVISLQASPFVKFTFSQKLSLLCAFSYCELQLWLFTLIIFVFFCRKSDPIIQVIANRLTNEWRLEEAGRLPKPMDKRMKWQMSGQVDKRA